MIPSTHRRPVNPFSTSRVRPGALPFLFPPGESAASLVEQLQANGWRGAIVGAHGSGKSTLLHALLPELVAAHRDPILIELHDGQKRLPALPRTRLHPRRTVVVIDGYEQLSMWQRLAISWRSRIQRVGLLVTTHRSVGLPLLYRTQVSEELAGQVVELLVEGGPRTVAVADVTEALAVHSGNLRETLFALYDVHECRQRSQNQAANPDGKSGSCKW